MKITHILGKKNPKPQTNQLKKKKKTKLGNDRMGDNELQAKE